MKRGATAAVYIMANARRTTLYTGVTADLRQRVAEHKAHLDPRSFTARYNVDRLVYVAFTADIRAAIAEEKRIKGGSRASKVALIESTNPEWRDLSESW